MQRLTEAQANALMEARAKYGKRWKAALSQWWMYANYPSDVDASVLQSIRNAFGPSWLYSYKCGLAMLNWEKAQFERYANIQDPL
jgi:hypothetical protein